MKTMDGGGSSGWRRRWRALSQDVVRDKTGDGAKVLSPSYYHKYTFYDALKGVTDFLTCASLSISHSSGRKASEPSMRATQIW